MTTVAEQTVQEFLAREGTREDPPGSNCVPGLTDTYPAPGGCEEWCAITVSVLSYIAANKLGVGPPGYLPDLAGYGPGSAYVPHFTNWADRENLWVDPHQAQPGDIIIFGQSDHIGITLGPMDATGTIQTAEGNTGMSAGAASEYLAVRWRDQSWVLGVLRPPMWQLSADSTTTPPAAPTQPAATPAAPADPLEALMADNQTKFDELHDVVVTKLGTHPIESLGGPPAEADTWAQANLASTAAQAANDKADVTLAKLEELKAAVAALAQPAPTDPNTPTPAPVPEKTLADFPPDEVIAFALPLIEQKLGYQTAKPATP